MAWKNRQLVVETFHNNPDRAVDMLASLMTQEEIDLLEPVLCPEPPDALKAQLLAEALDKLDRAGVPGDDPVVIDLASRVDALTPVEEPIEEPIGEK